MLSRASTICASVVGLAFLPGLVRADFIPWSYTTTPQGTVPVFTDLMPLPPGNNGNVTGEGQIILSGVTSSRQLSMANNFFHVPLLSDVTFHIDRLGNGDWQPTTATVPLSMVITDLASHKTGTLTFTFDVSFGFGFPFGPISVNDNNLADNRGQTLTLGGNQYVVAAGGNNVQGGDMVIVPVSANTPEPTGWILGILGMLNCGIVAGIRYCRGTPCNRLRRSTESGAKNI